MSRRITSRSRLENDEESPAFSQMVNFTWNGIRDFDYWVNERLKLTAIQDDRKWAEHNLEAIEDNISQMEDMCKSLHERRKLVLSIIRLRDQIRRLREGQSLSEFEIRQRQRNANELENGKLKELEAALEEMVAV